MPWPGLVSAALPREKCQDKRRKIFFLFPVEAVFEIPEFSARGGDQEKKAPKAFGFYHIMMNLGGRTAQKEKGLISQAFLDSIGRYWIC